MRISTATKANESKPALEDKLITPSQSTQKQSVDQTRKLIKEKKTTDDAKVDYAQYRAKKWLEKGSTLLEKNDTKEAIQILKQAYTVFYSKRKNSESLSDLSQTAFYLGECYSQQKNYRVASNYLEEVLALSFLKTASQKPLFSPAKSGLCNDQGYKNMISSFTSLLRNFYLHPENTHLQSHTFALFNGFINNSGNDLNTIKSSLAYAYLQQGYDYQIEGNYAKSLQFFKLTITLTNPSENATIALALANFALARSYILMDKEEDAIPFLNTAHERLKALLIRTPHGVENEIIQLQIADIAKHLALCHKRQRNYLLAKTYLEEADIIYLEHPRLHDSEDYAVMLLARGLCEYFISGTRTADSYFFGAIEYFQKIKEDSPNKVNMAFATVGIWLTKQDAVFINSDPFRLILLSYNNWKTENPNLESQLFKRKDTALPTKRLNQQTSYTVEYQQSCSEKRKAEKTPILKRHHSLPELHHSVWKSKYPHRESMPSVHPTISRVQSVSFSKR
jgi:tetratricopeptide (TPR) repeat protein